MKTFNISKGILLLTLTFLFSGNLLSAAPSPGELEQALLKYILCYEAYREARESDSLEVRSNLSKYVKEYREAYAKYLELLRESDLYCPADRDFNPAGDYNTQRINNGEYPVLWNTIGNKADRKEIKKQIKNGRKFSDIMKDISNKITEHNVKSIDTNKDPQNFWSSLQGEACNDVVTAADTARLAAAAIADAVNNANNSKENQNQNKNNSKNGKGNGVKFNVPNAGSVFSATGFPLKNINRTH